MCACVRAVGEFEVVGELNSHGREAKRTIQQVSFQAQEPDFFHPLSPPLLSANFTSHLYSLYALDALRVQNVEGLLTVWWSKA